MLGNSKITKIAVVGMALMMLLSSTGAVMAASQTASISNSTADETTNLTSTVTIESGDSVTGNALSAIDVQYQSVNMENIMDSTMVSVTDPSGSSVSVLGISTNGDTLTINFKDGIANVETGEYTIDIQDTTIINPSTAGDYTVTSTFNPSAGATSASDTVTVESASTATPTPTDSTETSTPDDGTDTSTSTEEPTHDLTFDVNDIDGNAIEGATVEVSQNDSVVESATSDADGAATVSGLSDGTYSVSVNGSDYKSVSQSVEVSADMTVTAELVSSDSVEMSEMSVSEAGDGGGSGTVPTDNIMIIGAFAVIFVMISAFLAVKD